MLSIIELVLHSVHRVKSLNQMKIDSYFDQHRSANISKNFQTKTLHYTYSVWDYSDFSFHAEILFFLHLLHIYIFLQHKLNSNLRTPVSQIGCIR